MVQFIPPPDTRTLLPPFLACLPASFVSSRPPPALLPLLSPILRQRIQLLSASANSPTDSWLPLLCWNAKEAEELPSVVENGEFEPHPVSGEIEIEESEDIKYRRLDEDTLQARLILASFGLNIIFVWCEGDEEGGGNGWRVAEVMPDARSEQIGNDAWYSSISEANEKSNYAIMADALRQGEDFGVGPPSGMFQKTGDDDDGYWAQYDNASAQTPAADPSPVPKISNGLDHAGPSEADYYAQYAQVQPALDNDDPSEDRNAGESTLNGDSVIESDRSLPPNVIGMTSQLRQESDKAPVSTANVDHPQPFSLSAATSTVGKLEDSAVLQSHAEVAVQQHISTSIKSLFRLARGSGIEQEDFERIVHTELEILSMMTEDD